MSGWINAGYPRFLLFQFGILVFFVLMLLFFSGYASGLSFLYAGLSVILPHWLLAVLALKTSDRTGGCQPRTLLARLYWGECLKIFLTILLIACMLAFISVVQGVFLLGFVMMQMTVWVLPVFIR